MSKRPIRPPGIFSGGQYSPVIDSEGLVFLSGQVPCDEMGALVSEDFAVQARQVFENMRRCLAAAGCTLDDVVKVIGFLDDLGNAAQYGDIYAEFFAEPYPARSTVQAGLAAGFKVEVEAIARKPSANSASRAGARS